jgi:hypothetical protein
MACRRRLNEPRPGSMSSGPTAAGTQTGTQLVLTAVATLYPPAPLMSSEGFWSLLRSWLRPHRGIPQESLPLYLGFFEFVHNVRARGKRLLGAMIGQLLAPPCNPL